MAVSDEDWFLPRQGIGDGENVPGEVGEREVTTFAVRSRAQTEPWQIDCGYGGAARQQWNSWTFTMRGRPYS